MSSPNWHIVECLNCCKSELPQLADNKLVAQIGIDLIALIGVNMYCPNWGIELVAGIGVNVLAGIGVKVSCPNWLLPKLG